MTTIERSSIVRYPLATLWRLYQDVANLPRLVEPGTRIAITPPDARQHMGSRFELRVMQFGVPVRWGVEITGWEETDRTKRFVDIQRYGPFSSWEHTHIFEAVDDDTSRMTDIVRYEVSLGILGRVADSLFVHDTVSRMIDYRHTHTERILGEMQGL